MLAIVAPYIKIWCWDCLAKPPLRHVDKKGLARHAISRMIYNMWWVNNER